MKSMNLSKIIIKALNNVETNTVCRSNISSIPTEAGTYRYEINDVIIEPTRYLTTFHRNGFKLIVRNKSDRNKQYEIDITNDKEILQISHLYGLLGVYYDIQSEEYQDRQRKALLGAMDKKEI